MSRLLRIEFPGAGDWVFGNCLTPIAVHWSMLVLGGGKPILDNIDEPLEIILNDYVPNRVGFGLDKNKYVSNVVASHEDNQRNIFLKERKQEVLLKEKEQRIFLKEKETRR